MMKDNGRKTKITTIDVNEQPLYRVRKPLWYKETIIRPGSLHRLEKLDRVALERLTLKNTIAEVQAPPLSILPGWRTRSHKLAEAGVHDAVQLLGADEKQTAAYMRVRVATVQRWKDEIMQWLEAPAQRG